MNRWISAFTATVCAGVSAFVYEANVNPGHGPDSPWYMAAFAGFAACVWAWVVFPKMGRGWIKDTLWIAIAYPSVGALAGALVSFGHPLGIYGGVMVALSLPIMFPKIILPVYIAGACLAFVLPRMHSVER